MPSALTASVLFGKGVYALTRPGERPAQVTDFSATASTESACRAIDALDGALGLASPGTARLLVIVSDAMFVAPGEPAGVQQRITRLHRAGCGVIILTPALRRHLQVHRLPGHRGRQPRRRHRRHRPRRHPRPHRLSPAAGRGAAAPPGPRNEKEKTVNDDRITYAQLSHLIDPGTSPPPAPSRTPCAESTPPSTPSARPPR